MIRICIGLASIALSILLTATGLGLVPDRERAITDGRKALCEAIAIPFSLAARDGDFEAIRVATLALVERDPEILSAGVRKADGTLMVEAGGHRVHWGHQPGKYSTPTHMRVPIAFQDKLWGTVELRFRPPTGTVVPAFLGGPLLPLFGFFALTYPGASYLFLRKVIAAERGRSPWGRPRAGPVGAEHGDGGRAGPRPRPADRPGQRRIRRHRGREPG